MRRKVYGQSKVETCMFCDKNATLVNSQGVPACLKHKEKILEDKRCICGEWMSVKSSKWGAFYLCPSCGPKSFSKADSMDSAGYKLNKKFREKEKPEKVYTLDPPKLSWTQCQISRSLRQSHRRQ